MDKPLTENIKEHIDAIKASANKPKSELMRIADSMESISPKKAKILNTIIAKIERWQNSR